MTCIVNCGAGCNLRKSNHTTSCCIAWAQCLLCHGASVGGWPSCCTAAAACLFLSQCTAVAGDAQQRLQSMPHTGFDCRWVCNRTWHVCQKLHRLSTGWLVAGMLRTYHRTHASRWHKTGCPACTAGLQARSSKSSEVHLATRCYIGRSSEQHNQNVAETYSDIRI